MLKFIFVPNPLHDPFQKLEVNLEYLSDTIALGTPCSLEIYFMQISAMLATLQVILTGIKCVTFVSFSTTTMMDSC
jgi:hypothetical protein